MDLEQIFFDVFETHDPTPEQKASIEKAAKDRAAKVGEEAVAILLRPRTTAGVGAVPAEATTVQLCGVRVKLEVLSTAPV